MFDAAFMSFTLKAFEPADIARVLAELARVLRSSGRLAVVSLYAPPEPSLALSAYAWLHRRFPHWIDCHRIELTDLLHQAGYRTTSSEPLSLFGLSVMAALAFPPRQGSPAWIRPRGVAGSRR
jgi:ubiquinone/menaquinone biosynthesis C-methylase UbiE